MRTIWSPAGDHTLNNSLSFVWIARCHLRHHHAAYEPAQVASRRDDPRSALVQLGLCGETAGAGFYFTDDGVGHGKGEGRIKYPRYRSG